MNKLPLLALTCLMSLAFVSGTARADVVRPAPNFTVANGQALTSWKGQPVVLLIAPSPNSSEFRKQARRIEAMYQEFAARKAIFVAVFTNPVAADALLPSNVPFVRANSGEKVAAAYGFDGKFNVSVVGKDGNLDLNTSKIVPASQIMDMIINNYEQQAVERKL